MPHYPAVVPLNQSMPTSESCPALCQELGAELESTLEAWLLNEVKPQWRGRITEMPVRE